MARASFRCYQSIGFKLIGLFNSCVCSRQVLSWCECSIDSESDPSWASARAWQCVQHSTLRHSTVPRCIVHMMQEYRSDSMIIKHFFEGPRNRSAPFSLSPNTFGPAKLIDPELDYRLFKLDMRTSEIMCTQIKILSLLPFHRYVTTCVSWTSFERVLEV